jgi:hypothetical protein
MSLTAHFITDDWVLVTRCLATQYYPDRHTAVNISDFIKDGLSEYGMRIGNVVTVTTDSAANMVAAARTAGRKQQLTVIYICYGLFRILNIIQSALTSAKCHTSQGSLQDQDSFGWGGLVIKAKIPSS